MALLYMDGFEWVDPTNTGTNKETTMVSKAINVVDMIASTNAEHVTGRGGRGQALKFGSSFQFLNSPKVRKPLDTGEFITGFAMKPTATFSTSAWLYLYGNEVIQTALRYNTGADTVTLYRGDSSLIATSPANLILPSVWQYIEIKIKTHDTEGFIVMRINGQVVWESATDLDTRFTAGVNWDRCRLMLPSLSTLTTVDDWYIADTTGTENNDFLGDVAVETILPSEDGSFTEWTTSGGGTHKEHVDDIPLTAPPDDTTYVSSDALNETELFQYSNLINTNNRIYGVQVNPLMKITEGSFPVGVANVVRSKNKEDTADPLTNVKDSNKIRHDDVYFHGASIFTAEPRDSQRWTIRDVNNSQFGVRRVTGTT